MNGRMSKRIKRLCRLVSRDPAEAASRIRMMKRLWRSDRQDFWGEIQNMERMAPSLTPKRHHDTAKEKAYRAREIEMHNRAAAARLAEGLVPAPAAGPTIDVKPEFVTRRKSFAARAWIGIKSFVRRRRGR